MDLKIDIISHQSAVFRTDNRQFRSFVRSNAKRQESSERSSHTIHNEALKLLTK